MTLLDWSKDRLRVDEAIAAVILAGACIYIMQQFLTQATEAIILLLSGAL